MNPSSEREAFEAWDSAQYEIDAQVYAHKRNDRYVDRPVQGRWEAWQARASLSNQPQQAGWMPIETAPKTGRTLLLGYFNSAGNWRTMRGQWMSQDYIDEYWEEPDDAEPGWFETVVEGDDIPNCWRTEPTHWMPLPLPPVPGQEGVE